MARSGRFRSLGGLLGFVLCCALASPAQALGVDEAFGAALDLATGSPDGDAAAAGAALPFATAETVPAEQLAEMRGGFALGSGMTVNFGFDLMTSANGAPLQRLTLAPGQASASLTDYARDGTASLTQLPAGGAPVRVDNVLNGGLTRMLSEFGPGGATQVLSNRADGVALQRSAIIDVEIGGMAAMLTRRAQDDVMATALGARRALGR